MSAEWSQISFLRLEPLQFRAVEPEEVLTDTVAYGFWLHRMTGSAMEANHLTRDYGITHHPAPHRPSPDPRTAYQPCEHP
ncbi:DUF6417 family protein [Streptomyces sp. VNUA24]|uniref:DUF6417 family protein n=1 Tax=Streptomyces sp. VNUA24 TaxID=3031131 RepID=UPI0023B82C12|nr:DUF6417 family protein [Streptomyces sp. VNUA24]WEH12376.1 DUF6417 family protein [Streptomyces sp. VNUA24]